jgi:uncharacterized oxidoreductase
MKTSGNTILITGGATGIGLALAEAFLKAGNEVIICGRREERLLEAQSQLPGLQVRACNLAHAAERQALYEWATENFLGLNVLVNNAGIQRQIDFKKGAAELLAGQDEIEINLQAPVHLSALFIPYLMQQAEAALVMVSSGLGFIPISSMPVYCATKAALHSLSWSLRHQLRQTSVKVFEIVPPTVDTELDQGARGRRGQTDRGIHPREVAEAALRGLAEDEFEIAVGQAQWLRTGARTDPESVFQRMNGH